MLIQDDREKRSEILLGFLLVAIGVAIGVGIDVLMRPIGGSQAEQDAAVAASELARSVDTDSDVESQTEPVQLQIPMLRNPEPAAELSNDLETVTIEVSDENAEILQKVYDRSMNSGLIVQTEGDLVEATIGNRNKLINARIRIKGDYLDHLNTDKWSFRVELRDDKMFGMSRFSVQHPKARGYLWEWLIMQVARREGLLAPRSSFVNVVFNGNNLGIYYLEEHFTKELLESQGRREGPIVRFDETAAMSATEQYDFQQMFVPKTVHPAESINQAEISAFGAKRLGKSENLARQFLEALGQMRKIQAGIRTWLPSDNSAIGRYQAKLERADTALEEVLDVDSAAQMHALVCMFRCKHGMAWKNRRFYHNPITGRLEPIVYDTLAGTAIPERDPLAMGTHTVQEFLRSTSYYNRLFTHLARMTNPSWLGDILDELGPELTKYAELMKAEGMNDPQADVAVLRDQLWDQQIYLRETLRPADAINFEAELYGQGGNTGEIIIKLWGTTRVPIVVRGFRYANGHLVSAQRALDSRSGAGLSRLSEESGGVVIPHDSSRVTFRFPADARYATLTDIEDIKNAVRTQAIVDSDKPVTVIVEYRLLTETEVRTEQLDLRRFEKEWLEEGGRPIPPSLKEALEEHGFLQFDQDSGQLSVQPGEWEVAGDLVVPADMPLHIGPGVTLRFDQESALVTGTALQFIGTEDAPIVLGPKAGLPSWAGVTVLRASAPSRWEHVKVYDTNIIRRGGWMMTGGVTFYRCEVELYDCLFKDAHGEDALNIYGTELLLERVTIDTCASDAFDGDFVTGIVRDCIFMNSVEDAVDVSGSKLKVEGCRFIGIGDKAISAGENSVVSAKNCIVESASIAVASKDFSRVDVDGLQVDSVTNYAFAAYIKKPEYGPSSIVAVNVNIDKTGRGDYLIQTPCTLNLNGDEKESVEVDVKQMYEDKILGQ